MLRDILFLPLPQAQLQSNISSPFPSFTSLVFAVCYTQPIPVPLVRQWATQKGGVKCIIFCLLFLSLYSFPSALVWVTHRLHSIRGTPALAWLTLRPQSLRAILALVWVAYRPQSLSVIPPLAWSVSFQQCDSSYILNNISFHMSSPLLFPLTAVTLS